MVPGQSSRTAFGAATHRAVHQLLEAGRIFADPLAVPILGPDAEKMMREAMGEPRQRALRFFLAARARYAESRLADGVAGRGIRQLVVMGAGLDTFAYRSPYGESLPVFEIDHPDTQAWKRDKLREAAIAEPSWLTFVPVDFERDRMPAALVDAGFDPRQRTFFTWLGVVPYLTRGAIFATLGDVAGFAGAEIVFDFSEPPGELPPAGREAYETRAARVAGFGEPWLSALEAAELHERLAHLGFTHIEDLGPRETAMRYFPRLAERFPERGGRLVHAAQA